MLLPLPKALVLPQNRAAGGDFPSPKTLSLLMASVETDATNIYGICRSVLSFPQVTIAFLLSSSLVSVYYVRLPSLSSRLFASLWKIDWRASIFLVVDILSSSITGRVWPRRYGDCCARGCRDTLIALLGSCCRTLSWSSANGVLVRFCQ